MNPPPGVPVGSSPHTRGAPRALLVHPARVGIIPAYAGSTRCSSRVRTSLRDHPRIRGEHAGCSVFAIGVTGSSPHTRGARLRRPGTEPRRRIIPAYAGSTPMAALIPFQMEDHPRIRGEHCCKLLAAPTACGSSPHTRGAPLVDTRGQKSLRIIPAYAGSTPSKSPRGKTNRDHPRIRGEHDGWPC